MEEIIRRVQADLASLTARVAALEDASPARPPRNIPPVPNEAATLRTEAPKSSAPSAATPRSPSEPIGGKLLGGAAVICFLLAAVFLIRLAVDNGWLTPMRQLGMAALFGGSLIGAGFALRGSDAPYASILPGAGLTILWACANAGYALFGIFSEPASVVLLWILCGLSLSLFSSFKQAYFLFAMVACAYTIPLFLHSRSRQIAHDEMHFLVWDLLFCVLALRLQSRRLMALAAYFALIVFYAVSAQPGDFHRSADLSLAAFQFLQLVVFGAFVLHFSSRWSQPLTESEAWYFAPALLFFYATEYSFTYELNPEAAPWIALFFAALLAAAEVFAQGLLKKADLPSRVVVVSMIAVILFHAGYIEILSPAAEHWVSLLLLLAWPAAERRGLEFRTYPVAVMAYWLIIAIEFCKAFHSLGSRTAELHEIVFSGVYAILLLAAYFGARPSVSRAGKKHSDTAAFMLICGATLQAGLFADRVGYYAFSGPTIQMAISALFAGYAFGLMALARTYGDRWAANGALAAFIVVSLKILTIDLAESAPLVKIATLVVVGALLYGGGMLSRQIRPAARGPE